MLIMEIIVIFLIIAIIVIKVIWRRSNTYRYTLFLCIKYIVFGLAVKQDSSGGVDLCLSFIDSNKLWAEICPNISFFVVLIIGVIVIIVIIVQVNALLDTLELTDSALHKGQFSLYNYLVLGHTKYSGVQQVYCNPFSAKPFHCCHQ